jgi:hypothetical protein
MVRVEGPEMSLDTDFDALAALFEEACALNREALTALRGGVPVPALNGLFERKKRLTELLTREQEILSRKKAGPGFGSGLARALQAQREAAMLEVKLAEALGNPVPSNGNVIAAYKNAIPGHGDEGLDQSI